MKIQTLEFIPAELNEILSKYGFSWPKHLPMAASGGKYRSFEEICKLNELNPEEVPITKILDVLVNGKELFNVSRIARRKYLDNWHLLTKTGTDRVVAFAGSPEITICWFENISEFWNWLLGDFENFKMPEIPKTAFKSLSPAAFYMLIGLCDFFIRSFPLLNAEWKPEAPLVFSISSLKEDMKNKNGWLSAWSDFILIPRYTDEELDKTAQCWCHEQLLTPIDVPGGTTAYMLGNELTWLVRSMAWWDKGLVLKNKKYEVYFIQASALWIFAKHDKNWEASAIEGEDLFRFAAKFSGIKFTKKNDRH